MLNLVQKNRSCKASTSLSSTYTQKSPKLGKKTWPNPPWNLSANSGTSQGLSPPPLKQQRLAALGQLIVGLDSRQLQLSIIKPAPAPNHPQRWRAKESPRISSSSLQSRLSGLFSLASTWCVVSQLSSHYSPLCLSLPRASIKLHLKLRTCFSTYLPLYKRSRSHLLTYFPHRPNSMPPKMS